MGPEGFEDTVAAAIRELDPDRLEFFIATATEAEKDDKLRLLNQSARNGLLAFCAGASMSPSIWPASAVS